MRIIILGTAHPFRGGLASYNERLAHQLIYERHEVEIMTFTMQYPDFLFPGKTQFSEAPAPSGLRIRRILNSMNPFSWLKTGLLIRKLKPDILLIKYWHPAMSPCLGSVARLVRNKKGRKTRVICIFDNVVPHEKGLIDRILTSYFTRGIDGAIVMSQSVGEDLKLFNVNIPVQFSPHPLYDNYGILLAREEALEKLKLDPSFSYLLFFGFIRAYKGLDLLLEAFADSRLRNRKIKLIVAGEFYESEMPYFEIIKNRKLAEEVIILGRYIKECEVAPLFCSADLIVQPYRSATQSGVTQIAYHFDKPMVVTDVGGLSEIVPDGRCGYVVKADPVSIADAINDYFSKGMKEEFTKNVQQEKSKYTWDKMTLAISDIYDRAGKE